MERVNNGLPPFSMPTRSGGCASNNDLFVRIPYQELGRRLWLVCTCVKPYPESRSRAVPGLSLRRVSLGVRLFTIVGVRSLFEAELLTFFSF